MTENKRFRTMQELYEQYKETLKHCKAPLKHRQKINADMREMDNDCFRRKDYNKNKSDITMWNEMISELENDMRSIEMYLDFDERILLHRDYDNMKNMIYNQNSYEGEIPFQQMYGTCVPDTTDIICDVELQEEIVQLLDEVLTERQKQVVYMYFWEGMTQDKIAKKLGLKQNTISQIITNSLEILRNCIDIDEIVDFLRK